MREVEGHPPLSKDPFQPWGRTTFFWQGSPLSRSANLRGRSLIFLGAPLEVEAVGKRNWGVPISYLLWGWINSLLCALGQFWLRQRGRSAAILGTFGSRGTEHGTQDMEERPAAYSALEMGFSVCAKLFQHQTPAVLKHPDISSRAS